MAIIANYGESMRLEEIEIPHLPGEDIAYGIALM